MHTQQAATHDRRDRERRLAATYSAGYEAVEQYRRVQRFAADHPDAGSTAIATALDLPRGRIRPWLDDAMPDPMRAVDVAAARGWLDAEPGDRTFGALVVLHGWVVGGGSINERNWQPSFTVHSDDPGDAVSAALDAVGVQSRLVRPDADGRAPEYRPTTHGTVLGRYLAGVLDAPVGAKAHGDVTIPEWLRAAPFDTRLRWARTLVSLRGTAVDPARGYRLKLQEKRRPATYYTRVGQLLAGLVGDESQVGIGDNTVLLRERAAAMCDQPPELPS